MGDFNMRTIINMHANYNNRIEEHMRTNYNMQQQIQEPTNDKNNILDLCFTNTNVTSSVIWTHWSDHSIIAINI